jgi:hypothetical protein
LIAVTVVVVVVVVVVIDDGVDGSPWEIRR